jgi:exopolyphosphatase/guanosine-5'-triphosphate,3'-diphosphate pyrophosphatase
MRTAVVDIGTNSTRLLVAYVDTESGQIEDLHRESQVTRLGDGVDAGGRLCEEAMGRVFSTLSDYRATIDRLGCEKNMAVLTSAVRDASNGGEFTEQVR